MAILPVVLLSSAEDMCPRGSVCQASPNSNPDANSDLDSDDSPTTSSAWAGIAVVIVAVIVSIGVWYGLRRKRRARRGHNSVDVGGERTRFAFGRRFGAFWQKRFARRGPQQTTITAGELELVQGEEPKDNRRSSYASNLKRTTTSGTTETELPHGAKLNAQLKEEKSGSQADPVTPSNHRHQQSSETAIPPVLSEPSPTYDASRTIRTSTSSSRRSSLSRLSIPPPGLGPPIHDPTTQPLSLPASSHASSSTTHS
ncbi:hypothetical protein BDV93DRAFT_522761 [Ceratobasidium sp. AG-I]|nr:hypothetical protein BDV93DRAFT_522761 [Ceratobasidium sp. AG-I]